MSLKNAAIKISINTIAMLLLGKAGFASSKLIVKQSPIQIQASTGYRTCGIDSSQNLFCWGSDFFSDGSHNIPVAIMPGLKFKNVSIGGSHACALDHVGKAFCWGYNYNSQLGDNTTTNRSSPVPVASGLKFSQISVGSDFTCAMTLDNKPYCWGLYIYDSDTREVQSASQVPQLVRNAPDLIQIATGHGVACGLSQGGYLFCWASTLLKGSYITPRQVSNIRFKQIGIGKGHACGIVETGEAYCWGDTAFGQTGTGTCQGDTLLEPSLVFGQLRFKEISVNYNSTCGTTTEGKLYCWGYENSWMPSDNTCLFGNSAPVPVLTRSDIKFDHATVGDLHTCGIGTNGQSYCWGLNQFGQLGTGNNTTQWSPALIAWPAK